MTEPKLPGLPADVDAFLASERARPEPDGASRARLDSRLAVSYAAGAFTPPKTSLPHPQSTTPARLARWGRPLALAGLSFATGAGVGIAVDRSVVGRQPSVVTAPPATVPVETAIPAESTPAPPASAAPTASASDRAKPATTASSSSAPASSGGRDTELAAERAQIEIARSALARGNAGGAWEALERHRRAFPRGQLSDEREALTVQALAAMGRFAEARSRGELFLRQQPSSMMRPVVQATLAQLPEP